MKIQNVAIWLHQADIDKNAVKIPFSINFTKTYF